MSIVSLNLPLPDRSFSHALTSLPWPGERDEVPVASGVLSQAVPLFTPQLKPRLRRYLILCQAEKPLPAELPVAAGPAQTTTTPAFSRINLQVLKESLDKTQYVFREYEARISVAGREIGLRLGLLPNVARGEPQGVSIPWWQWCGAERLWSGPVADAWRVGGHLVPYGTDSEGGFAEAGLQDLAEKIEKQCGDILHGDLYLIIWKSGLIQCTTHFKGAYFHNWPKPIPAFPVLFLRGLKGTWREGSISRDGTQAASLRFHGEGGDTLDFSSCHWMFADDHPGRMTPWEDGVLIQPWQDLRVLANKSKENQLTFLEPQKPDVMPAGVNRCFWMNLGLNGADPRVARYQVPAAWYKTCGVLETDRPGPAAEMASRSVALIQEHTKKGGFDTGFVWRYLRRDIRCGIPQEDGAEWEGNLAQGLFQLAYQRGESPAENWELYLHHAYHAADISVYHGSWMGRLECASVLTAPLPKFRFGAMVYGYLETGDPYLLEMARSVAGVYMAMEWAHQPRFCMGRDSYPLSCLMALWDYSAEPLYLDFARQTAIRLLRTQMEDGGFAGQAGAGKFTGISCLPGKESISFGNGLLSPIALLEWAVRDSRWPADFKKRLRKWFELMIRVQPPAGIWLNGGSIGKPYPLIGSAALFSLIQAGQMLSDDRGREAVRKYLATMNKNADCVSGTHSFLSALYAHVADAALSLHPA